MCWKVKTPKVNTDISGAQLVPQTDAATPDSPQFGGTEDTFNKAKGKKKLTIERNSTYNPTNL